MMLPRIEPLIFWLQLPNPTLQSVKAPSKVTRIQLPSVLCCGEGGRTRLASGWGRGWGVACDYVNKLVQFASRSRVGGNSKGSRECVRNTAEGLTYGRWIKRYRDRLQCKIKATQRNICSFFIRRFMSIKWCPSN